MTPQSRPHTSGRGWSSKLGKICEKAMAKDPRNRYPSMSALAGDLDRWLNPPRGTIPPIVPLVAAAVFLAFIIAIVA